MSHALAIAELFRATFAADDTFSGVACLGDLESETVVRPSLTFKCDTTPQNGSGSVNEFTLTIWVETSADGATAAAIVAAAGGHRTLCGLVRTALHGSGKAAMLAEVNESAAYEVHGLNAAPDSAGIEGNHYRTGIVATGTATAL